MKDQTAEQLLSDAVLDQIEESIREIGYGTVTLIVQNGKVVQLEKLDKIKLV